MKKKRLERMLPFAMALLFIPSMVFAKNTVNTNITSQIETSNQNQQRTVESNGIKVQSASDFSWGASKNSLNNHGDFSDMINTVSTSTTPVYVQLGNDVEIPADVDVDKRVWTIETGKKVYLDLAGHSLYSARGDSVCFIRVKGELSVEDSSQEQTGSISVEKAQKVIYVPEGGKFTLNSGTLTRTGTYSTSGLVHIYCGTMTMNGGILNGGENIGYGAVYVNGQDSKFIMNDGKITGNTGSSSSAGAGIYMATNATFIMNGGSIEDNKAKGPGAAICTHSSDETEVLNIEIHGGTIKNNYSEKNGGAISLINGNLVLDESKSKLEITGNTAKGYGGAIVGGSSTGETQTILMKAGTIEGNSANLTGSPGAGAIYYTGTFTMTGGKITKNKSGQAAVYMRMYSVFNMLGGSITENVGTGNQEGAGIWPMGKDTINIGENANITGNYMETPVANQTECNIYLSNSYFSGLNILKTGDEVTTGLGENIKVTSDWTGKVGVHGGKKIDTDLYQVSLNGTEEDIAKVVPDSSDFITILKDGKLYLYKHASHKWSTQVDANKVSMSCSGEYCDFHTPLTLVLNVKDIPYSGNEYDGATLTNTITEATGIKPGDIIYKGRGNTTYSSTTTAPVDAGTYTASVTINGKTATADFEITKKEINPTLTLKSWIYGESASSINLNGNTGNGKITYAYKKKDAEDSTYKDITEAELQNLSTGEYTLRATIAETTNYKGASATCDFAVTKASQEAPKVTFVPETIKGQANGQITGVTSAMEYRKEGEQEYISISGTEITGLPAGTYFVRYKEDENHTASEETKVTIAEGRQLKIAVPTEQTGYELTVDKDTSDWHGEAKLTFKLKDGYSKTDEFAVMVNGEKVTLDDQNTYTISNLEKDTDITVIGVADTTAPTGTITVGEKNWESFEKDITFDIFYKEKQNVKITAQDNGSGVKNISYYVADKAMTKEEVEALSEGRWTAYDNNNGMDLIENSKYVIYAKVTDNAGNTSYISSNGMVIDTNAPVIKGIESGNTYTKSTEITVTDENLATVTVDGEEVTLDENGKYILVPKDGAYTIVVTDKAGNKTTIDTVTVNKEVPSLTEPTVSQETLTYDGTEQTLITAGQTTGGKLEYSLDGENWSSELPTAKNAGTYDVRYRVVGDTDYQDVEEKTLTVTIAPKVIGITWSNTQFTYNGKTQQPTATATGILEGENCEITVKGGQKAVGKYIATAAEVSNQNYALPETGITTEFEIKAQKKPQNNNNSGNNNTAPEVNANRNKNTLALNAELKVNQSGNKINISWGKVQGAKGYDVYVQYCGKTFNAKSLNQVKNGNKTKITVKKVNGKKLNLKKNYKIYVVAYNYQGKKKVVLAKSIVAHIVGRKNTKETNVKAIRLNKSKFTLKVGRTALIKGKTILVNSKKKPLSDKHAKTFRYASDNKKIATVSKNGKIKAVAKGKCIIYVYARNGYTKKVQVTVK